MKNLYNKNDFNQFGSILLDLSILSIGGVLSLLRIVILFAGFFMIFPFAGQSYSNRSLLVDPENSFETGSLRVLRTLPPPNAINDNYNIDEDTPLNVAAPGVLANDSDPDGDIISVDSFDGVSVNGGIVVMNPDGSFAYTPATNFNGNDNFSYTITDGNGGFNTATVTIVLAAVNDPPLVLGDAYFVLEDNTLNVSTAATGVLNNDSDVEGNVLTISAFDATSVNGGNIIMTGNGRFAYTPVADFSGTDTFTYTASDGNGGMATATVTITVVPINDAPIANDDAYLIDEDNPLNIVAPGVLGNDTDLENNTLIISSFNAVSVQGGVVVVNPDGSFTYTPPSNFSGTDTFNYSIDDGSGGTASATVSFSVAPVNDDPQAIDDDYVTNEDTPLNIGAPGVLGNDTDVDGDVLMVSSFDTLATSGGTVAMNPNGSFTYTPPADFNGLDTFIYTLDDGNGATAFALVLVTVVPVNDDPLAVSDSLSTDEDILLTIGAPGVLANDTDAEAGLTVGSFDAVSANGGSIAMNPDGSFTYIPFANYFGIDTFNYTAEDADGATASAVVVITVNPINDDPQATDDTYSTDEDIVLNVVTPGTLGNDSDIEGDPLTVSDYQATTANGGTVLMNPDGSFDYTPPADFNGTDNFTYTVIDGNGGLSIATVTITVLPINDDPLALDDSYGTDGDTPLSIAVPGVLANDSDLEDVLIVASYDAVSVNGGTVVMNPDGSFVYTPASGFTGNDTFTYTVDDGNGGSAVATVTIAVAVPNTTPLAVDDFYETQEGVALIISSIEEGLLATDSDPDGDSLMVVAVTGALTTNGGMITINSDGTFQYTPPSGSFGTDTYEYTVCDDGIPPECTTAIISILVKEGPFTFNTGFTPNGDGFNETWNIEGILSYPNNVVKIYNRWGNLVYQAKGYNNNNVVWRGESNQGIIVGDRQVPSGSYYFLLDSGDGSKPVSGYVVLIR